MADLEKTGFDAAAFLANAGLGRRIIQLAPKEAFFSQGDPANAVFYIQKGRARVSVVSAVGKRQPSRLSPRGNLWERRPLRRHRDCVWRPLQP